MPVFHALSPLRVGGEVSRVTGVPGTRGRTWAYCTIGMIGSGLAPELAWRRSTHFTSSRPTLSMNPVNRSTCHSVRSLL